MLRSQSKQIDIQKAFNIKSALSEALEEFILATKKELTQGLSGPAFNKLCSELSDEINDIVLAIGNESVLAIESNDEAKKLIANEISTGVDKIGVVDAELLILKSKILNFLNGDQLFNDYKNFVTQRENNIKNIEEKKQAAKNDSQEPEKEKKDKIKKEKNKQASTVTNSNIHIQFIVKNKPVSENDNQVIEGSQVIKKEGYQEFFLPSRTVQLLNKIKAHVSNASGYISETYYIWLMERLKSYQETTEDVFMFHLNDNFFKLPDSLSESVKEANERGAQNNDKFHEDIVDLVRFEVEHIFSGGKIASDPERKKITRIISTFSDVNSVNPHTHDMVSSTDKKIFGQRSSTQKALSTVSTINYGMFKKPDNLDNNDNELGKRKLPRKAKSTKSKSKSNSINVKKDFSPKRKNK